MELYLYDILVGGAGFCKQIEALVERVFTLVLLDILGTCPEKCDRSCYRCLRRSIENPEDVDSDQAREKDLVEAASPWA